MNNTRRSGKTGAQTSLSSGAQRIFSSSVSVALNVLKECKGKGKKEKFTEQYPCRGTTRSVSGWCDKCKRRFKLQLWTENKTKHENK